MKAQTASPYTMLATCYDAVMAHVDYVAWAEYVFELLQRHYPRADNILELGCGTGSLALELQQLGSYRYRASDRSMEMLIVAARKAEEQDVPITFSQIDFCAIPEVPGADVILLLYDGINYLLEVSDIEKVFRGVHRSLNRGGVFVFDQSTPANSLNNKDGFDDSGHSDDAVYFRSSTYEPDARLHTTTFRLEIGDEYFEETHVQRAYTLAEIEALIAATPFAIEAAYDGLTFDKARPNSERIHWVLRKPLG